MLTPFETKLFKTLSELNAISGQENQVASFLLHAYQQFDYPTITDHLGSVFAVKKSGLPMPKKFLFLVTWMKLVSWSAISKLTE